jgi:hypothetical protein
MTDATEEKPKAPRSRATKTEDAPTKNIYQRMAAIASEVGVLEATKSDQGGVPFKFRGIDATVAHLTPLMNKYEVFAAPRVLSHVVTERPLNNGKLVKTTQLEVEFTFYGPEGDSVVAVTPGLADDFGDRSTAQAMSVAYRTALLQTFHIAAFGVEPEASGQAVINERDAAANAKIQNAANRQAPAAQAPATGQLIEAIKAAAAQKGMGPQDLNALGDRITGTTADVWFNDPAALDKILQEISK